MTEHLLKTIEDLEEKLRAQVQEVARTRRMINDLCRMADQPDRYPSDADDGPKSLGSIKPDSFYGRPLATVIREYLAMRRAAGQSAGTVTEIHLALKQGGYEFDTEDEDNAKRGLRSSLSKNPIFHKLPNGQYGLTDWYPAAKKKREDEEEGKEEDEKPQKAEKPGDVKKAPEKSGEK